MANVVLSREERLSAETEPLCRSLLERVGLKQGSLLIHAHRGYPVQLEILDKGVKFKQVKYGS